MILVDPTAGDPPSTTRIVGCHVTPGNPADQSPYRSKLSGIYGILCIVEELCKLHDIKSGGITIGCDNEKCLWMAIDKRGTTSPTSSSFDLLSAIRHKILKLPVSVSSHWVEGHQDNFLCDPSRLDLWARLNIEMDTLAKLFWEDSRSRIHNQQCIHDETQAVYVRGTKICNKISHSLYFACKGANAKLLAR
eukprot:scaffold123677_cov34-Attheya_sp.AAC.4